MARKRLIRGTEWNEDGTQFSVAFVDGKSFLFDFAKTPGFDHAAWMALPFIVKESAKHGANQKLRDSAAGAGTVEIAKDNMEKVCSALYAGEWRTKREAMESDEKLVLKILKSKAPERYEQVMAMPLEKRQGAIAKLIAKLL
jgi:hypothetical protein